MKTLIACVYICVLGCGSAPETIEQSAPHKTEDPTPVTYTNPSQSVTGCGSLQYTVTLVDGVPTWIPLPMVCGLGPHIDKGDPAPDMGDPWKRVLPGMKEYRAQEKSYQK